MTEPCRIDPNPDIAGPGVRYSVYTQILLNFVCAIIFAKDGQISSYENSVLTATSQNLFITGSSLILCAAIQTALHDLSVYHAVIVLNLSWIISLSAFMHIVIALLNSFLALADSENVVQGVVEGEVDEPEASSANAYVVPMSILHLFGMGAFGIGFWATIDRFGKPDESKCMDAMISTVFGVDVHVLNNSLRWSSVGLYSLVVVPCLNFVLLAGTLVIGTLLVARILRQFENRNSFVLIGGIMVIFLLEVVFVVDTELLVSRSSKLVDKKEWDWSFGQTLAIISLLPPVIETVHAAYKSLKEGHGFRADIRAMRSRQMFPRQCLPLIMLVIKVVEPLAKYLFGKRSPNQAIGQPTGTSIRHRMTGRGRGRQKTVLKTGPRTSKKGNQEHVSDRLHTYPYFRMHNSQFRVLVRFRRAVASLASRDRREVAR